MKVRTSSRRISSVLLSGLFGLALVASSSTAFAAEQWVTDYVKLVYPLNNGNFIVSFVNPQPICTSTATPQYFNVVVGANGVTADGVKAMLATVLTALAADKQISVAFEAGRFASAAMTGRELSWSRTTLISRGAVFARISAEGFFGS